MRLLLPLTLAAALASPAPAADSRNTDWPCVQAKVPEISLGAVWNGPPIDDAIKTWQSDPRLRDLVPRLAARRTPLPDAQKAIADFVTGSAAERQEKATLLFAGLFATLNHERTEVMHGLERLARRQAEMVEAIRADTAKLRAQQDAPDRDQTQIDALANQVEWSTRIFDDRRRAVRYVCEVPVLIEQRLFALGRAIQQALE